MEPVLRVPRPTDHLEVITKMYRDGLGLETLGWFLDHEGFDGVMLGHPGGRYHLEITHHRGHPVGRAPTQDHLLVFYIPDEAEWTARCEQMRRAGFVEVASYKSVLGPLRQDLSRISTATASCSQRVEWR